ncbi:hypothetical protein SDC9_51957 [bioreactor metagenome]|uniref:Uncharacterized protein n=1 Tax=bioreactor metagenome TaxID=1076179 RepID=A0A644WP46_9ZZZZ
MRIGKVRRQRPGYREGKRSTTVILLDEYGRFGGMGSGYHDLFNAVSNCNVVSIIRRCGYGPGPCNQINDGHRIDSI